jgi:hypothetical protein
MRAILMRVLIALSCPGDISLSEKQFVRQHSHLPEKYLYRAFRRSASFANTVITPAGEGVRRGSILAPSHGRPGGSGATASDERNRPERRVVLFEWMRRGRGPLAEGLPRVRSSLPRAPSQPSWVPRDTAHEVLFTAWRNDQDSDCLMDACLCRCSQHG